MITKLDVLDEFDQIPVCVGYKIGGREVSEMPPTVAAIEKVEAVYECVPGWSTSTFGISKYEDLPGKAKDYIAFLESRTGVEWGVFPPGGRIRRSCGRRRSNSSAEPVGAGSCYIGFHHHFVPEVNSTWHCSEVASTRSKSRSLPVRLKRDEPRRSGREASQLPGFRPKSPASIIRKQFAGEIPAGAGKRSGPSAEAVGARESERGGTPISATFISMTSRCALRRRSRWCRRLNSAVYQRRSAVPGPESPTRT